MMRIYDKISDERREELIRQVVLYKVQMKLAARKLRIKYPTAKYILKRYRDYKEDFPRPKALDLAGYQEDISHRLKPYYDFCRGITEESMPATGSYDAEKLKELEKIKEEYPNIQE